MALTTVNGFLGDFAGSEPGLTPRIRWRPDGSATNGSKLLFKREIVTTISNSATGAWSQQFEPMDLLTPKVVLVPTLEWFEQDLNGGHWVAEDHPELSIVVPTSSGSVNFIDIVTAPANPDTIIPGFGPPIIQYPPGTWYYDMAAEPGTENLYIF